MMIIYILYKKDLRFYVPFAPKLICVRHWRAAPALIITTRNITQYKKKQETNEHYTSTVSTVLKKRYDTVATLN